MKTIGRLPSGGLVVDRHNSHLREDAALLLPEALARIHVNGRNFINEEIDFGRVIGETICVRTNPDDEILWARRKNRPPQYTRFVKNRRPESCSHIVVILLASKEVSEQMVLISAFIGRKAEPEPQDRNATPQSLSFWSTHALVWGREEITPGTETTICPW